MRAVGDGVWAVTAGSFPANSYICAADAPGGAVLVDAGLDPRPIDEAFQALGLRPASVLCTHGHFDHVGSASFFQRKYGAAVLLHRADLKTAKMANFLLNAMKMAERIELPEFTPVDDGHVLPLGRDAARFRHAPGHSPGSCLVAIRDALFTGDTIYARGLGLSKLPGEDPATLRESVRAAWGELDGRTVHPGHGPSATGEAVKRGNAELLAFLHLSTETEELAQHG